MALKYTIIALAAASVAANVHDRTFYEEKFFNWLKTHEVKPESGMHFVQMLRNFADNEDFINHHNSLDKTYKLGHNKFSHLNEAEWKEHVRLIKMDENRVSTTTLKHSAPANTASVPASVDWRTQGAVTPVKDQGQCGSCWSFSTTGSLEGAYQIKNGNLKSFSEQELVDCDTFKNKANRGTDMGCNGGIYDKAFDWTAKNGGLCTEADYPYTSGTTQTAGTCTTTCSSVAGSAAVTHTDVQVNSDSAMMSALAQQPVSIAIQADQKAFQLYKSGVFTDDCGSQLDHAVLAVGYGTQDGTDYYIVKNSWGTTWGDAGYILMGRGDSMPAAGQCGMLSGPPSYPNV